MVDAKLYDSFFRQGFEILSTVQKYAKLSMLSQSIHAHITYCHYVKRITLFESQGLLTSCLVGRERRIKLTIKGKNILMFYKKLLKLM